MKVKQESGKFGLKLNIQKTKIVASGPIISWETDGETVETGADFIFGGSKITADGDCSHEIKRHWRKVMTNQPRQHIKKQRYYFVSKGPLMAGWHCRLDGHEFEWTPGVGDGQGAWRAVIHGVTKSQTRLSDWTELNWTNGFSSSQVWMWELDYKESWALKNWCFWTVVLEKTFESPLDFKEIQSVDPKEDQSRVFIGRTDAESETPVFWPPDMKNQLIGKDPDSGKDWRQEEKGMTEDELVGWHHWLNGHEFE